MEGFQVSEMYDGQHVIEEHEDSLVLLLQADEPVIQLQV